MYDPSGGGEHELPESIMQPMDMNLTKIAVGAAITVGTMGAAWIAYKTLRSPPCHQDMSPMDHLSLELEQVMKSASQTHVDLVDGWNNAVVKAGQDLKKGMDKFMQEFKDLIFNKEMQDDMESIINLLGSLGKFDFDAVNYKTVSFILLALISKAQEQTELPFLKSSIPIHSEISTSQFLLAKRYGLFATNTYLASFSSSDSAIAKVIKGDDQDVLLTWFRDENEGPHCPKFILFLDHDTKALVLVIRGTFSFKDIILDIVCSESPFLNGFAHEGILDGAMKILEIASDEIEAALNENEGYKLVVCGHSLGGGTAELITLELLLGPSSELIPPGTRVSCVALAPPPVYRIHGNAKLPSSVVNAIEIYINNNDIVPRLSLGTVAKLLAMLRAVDHLDLSISQQFFLLAGRMDQEAEKNMEMVREAIKKVKQEKFAFLTHPGRVYHLVKPSVNSKNIIVEKQTSRIFSDTICLFDNMVLDHLYTNYQTAFEQTDKFGPNWHYTPCKK